MHFNFDSFGNSMHPFVKENLKDLEKLDSLLMNDFESSNKKEMRIGALRAALSTTRNRRDRLPLVRKLYEEYMAYNSDSAMKYIDEVYAIVSEFPQGNDSLIVAAVIDKAYISYIQGYHNEAADLLKGIRGKIGDNKLLKLKYYKANEYGVSMELVYASGNSMREEQIKKRMLMWRDSVASVSDVLRNQYIWLPIACKLERGNVKDVGMDELERLREAVDTISDVKNIGSPNAYWIARYYKETGDISKMVHYLTIDAQYKVKNQIREVVSLPELAQCLFELGDIDRAFNYLSYGTKQINAYNNRNRIVMLTSLITTVRDAYQEKLNERDKLLKISIYVLILVVLILLGAVAFIIMRNKKLHSIRLELSKVNGQLIETVDERDGAIQSLKEANAKLSELNNVNRGVIAFAFRLVSLQIGRLDDFRKKLLRKYKLKQYTELGSSLADDDVIKDRYKEFYSVFDQTILSIFPDFVKEYNETASEENKVNDESINSSKHLNMSLRIYALRRLGIDKSGDIAQMLNVSIRTVYNNRSPKGSKNSSEGSQS